MMTKTGAGMSEVNKVKVYREEDSAEVNRLRHERTVARRELKEVERRERLNESLMADLENFDSLTFNEYVALRAKLMEFRKSPGLSDYEAIDEGIKELGELIESHRTIVVEGNKQIRDLRIAARKVLQKHMNEHHAPSEVMCVACGKRPRHFGDYCKRCVPDSERPTGKV